MYVWTLIILRRNDKILLGKKLRNFGTGLLCGYGGKVNPGESIMDCARRELFEECQIECDTLRKVGELTYLVPGIEGSVAHLFTSETWKGEPQLTEEMEPIWVDISNIPYDQMFGDDTFWMTLFVRGKLFKGTFAGPSCTEITKVCIELVERFGEQ